MYALILPDKTAALLLLWYAELGAESRKDKWFIEPEKVLKLVQTLRHEVLNK